MGGGTPPIVYLDSCFYSLVTGSSGDAYLCGYFLDPDTNFIKGEAWRVDSSNVVSGTVLSYYDASDDFIYAGKDIYPYWALETSGGDAALFGQMNLVGSGTVGALWRVDTGTGLVSGTALLDVPPTGIGSYIGFAKRQNGDLICGTYGGATDVIHLWTVDSLNVVSATQLNVSPSTVYFYGNAGQYNSNNLVADPKTNNVWVLGGLSANSYYTGSIWKFVDGTFSGTLITDAGIGSVYYPTDAVFGDNDEMWMCGVDDNAGTVSAASWQFLTGSNYLTSTFLPHPGAGYSEAQQIVSSSIDGTLRVLGAYYDGTFNQPILWTTSDAFTTVSSTLLQYSLPVGGGSFATPTLKLDSLGDVWASGQVGDSIDYYKFAWKVDKTTGDVTSYVLAPPAGSTVDSVYSGFSILSDDTKRFAHDYTSDSVRKINLAKSNSTLTSTTNVTVGHVSGSWSNNLAYASSYNNAVLGDYADLNWNTSNASSVNVRVYNTDSLGWDYIATGLDANTASYQVFHGYGQSKRYLLDINPVTNYLSTSALIDYASSLYWNSAVFSAATGSGGSTWVLGQYTKATAPGPAQSLTVMWNVSSGNVVSGTILQHPDYVNSSYSIPSYYENQIISDPTGDVAYALSSVSSAPSVLWAVTGSTGDFSGTLLNDPNIIGGPAYAYCLTLGTTGSVWIGGNGFIWRLDPVTLEVSATLSGKPNLQVQTDATGSAWFLGDDDSSTLELLKVDGSTHELSGTLLDPLSGYSVSRRGYDLIFSGTNDDVWVVGESAGGATPYTAATAWRLDGSTGEVSSTYLPVNLGAGDLDAFASYKLVLKANGEVVVPGIYAATPSSRPVLWRLYGSPLQVSSTILNPWDYPNDYGNGAIALSNPVVDSSDNVWVAGTYAALNPLSKDSRVKVLWKLDAATLNVSSSFLYEDDGISYSAYAAADLFDLTIDSSDNLFFSLGKGSPNTSVNYGGGSLVKADSAGDYVTNVTLEVTGGYGV